MVISHYWRNIIARKFQIEFLDSVFRKTWKLPSNPKSRKLNTTSVEGTISKQNFSKDGPASQIEMMPEAINETLDKDEAEEETEELTNQLSLAPMGRIAPRNSPSVVKRWLLLLSDGGCCCQMVVAIAVRCWLLILLALATNPVVQQAS